MFAHVSNSLYLCRIDWKSPCGPTVVYIDVRGVFQTSVLLEHELRKSQNHNGQSNETSTWYDESSCHHWWHSIDAAFPILPCWRGPFLVAYPDG